MPGSDSAMILTVPFLLVTCVSVASAVADDPNPVLQPADVRAALAAVRAAHSTLTPLVIECDVPVNHSGSSEEIQAGIATQGLAVVRDERRGVDLHITSSETYIFDGRDAWRVEAASLLMVGPRDITVTVQINSPWLRAWAPSLRPATAHVTSRGLLPLERELKARKARHVTSLQESALKGYQTSVLWATGMLDQATDAIITTVHQPGREKWQRVTSQELGTEIEFNPATGEVGTIGVFLGGKPGQWTLFYYEGHSGPALFPARHPSVLEGQMRAQDGTLLNERGLVRLYRAVRTLDSPPDKKLFDPATIGSTFISMATREPCDATGMPLDDRPVARPKPVEQVSREFQVARSATPLSMTLARSIAGAVLLVCAIVWWRGRRG